MSESFNARLAAEWIEKNLGATNEQTTHVALNKLYLKEVALILREASALKDFRDWHCRTSDEGYMNEEKVP